MLTIHNLVKRYDERVVVDHVSLELPRGKFTAFIGPNGAGKSTVLNIAARLMPASGGTVAFDGRALGEWKSAELAKRLAILTQSNNVQMKLTVRELVAFGRFPHSGPRLTPEDEAKVEEAIAYMELTDLADSFIDEMSGGQRQRAFIAMVLAQDTDIVMLDEPSNNLDIYHATRMMKLLRRLCDDFGKTVVAVLHEINLAAFHCDHICAFKNGRLAASGDVESVMTPETLQAVYDVPFKIHRVEGRPLAIFH